MSKEIADEYASSLADLTVNSKPLINMLTILAEENIEHAGVIVDTVEKHLEKVHPDIKLPVLYLVDSIIKNVGGAYSQKFSQIIVNMFTRTFKQVDEKTRSQMFKLRETWHDVFPSTKLYQLDVKVNLIDPAWPIQSQPQQSNIHPQVATTSAVPSQVDEEEKMRLAVVKKEQELLMLQRKKIEMELEHTRKQLELASKGIKPIIETSALVPPTSAAVPPSSETPAIRPAVATVPEVAMPSVKQRLGPPVNGPAKNRIQPASGAMVAAARRDPRLARATAPAPAHAPAPDPNPDLFDIKPLDRVTKRKNVITIDVRPSDPRRPKPERRTERKLERKKEQPPPDNAFINKMILEPKKINKLPPIPKINRDDPTKNRDGSPKNKEEPVTSPTKRKHDWKKNKKRENNVAKEIEKKSPEKRQKGKRKPKPTPPEPEPAPEAFKELRNYHKERYMRRNKEKSPSPDTELEPANAVDSESKDVDLRVLPPAKRPSNEATHDGKLKKTKVDKFDILFGNEDVDLRQLPQVDEVVVPPTSSVTDSPKTDVEMTVPEINSVENSPKTVASPHGSPNNKKDWQEVKEVRQKSEEPKKPSQLDLVRAKLAEATKGKDRLGRPLLFCKSPSADRERRRTISSEDVDLRQETEDEVNKETISMILNQAKEHFEDGMMDKNQYNTLMFHVLQLNEKVKLKEAKQRESLENSKRKLHKVCDDDKPDSTANDQNRFGDIDERVPPTFMDVAPQEPPRDLDMRMGYDGDALPPAGLLPRPPPPPAFLGPYPPAWRGPGGPRPRGDEFGGPRRARGPAPQHPPFFVRNNFETRPRPPFEPPFVPPRLGMYQGESPLPPYRATAPPPSLGTPNVFVPPADYRVLEYIDQDPMKTIEIDGVPREIRYYGETAVIMLDWDDPREIRFLPGSRRVTFDNKDSVVLNFNDEYKKVEIDDQVFDIRFGAPTRELYVNGRWYECFFGAPPVAIMIDGLPRMIQLDGPPPQVDISKTRRTDLVAGKINLIVDAKNMCPVFLDGKVQKFAVDGVFYTIRFVDALRTVLINDVPFKVEFGGMPEPLLLGNTKHFIRFSVLPRHVKPGQINIVNMEGKAAEEKPVVPKHLDNAMDFTEDVIRPAKVFSPDDESNQGGLDMLASVMPSSMAPAASSSGYSLAEPMFPKAEGIPGLEVQEDNSGLPVLGNINVNDLFAKLVATGIVRAQENKEQVKKEEVKPKKEDKTVIHHVDLLKPPTLRVKQPGVVSRLYGGMQCSGCGARFPPERTVRYSQHLDWHFRQNRRERDSARRAHSRGWHYDLPDWLQYEELEDLDEREKNWFETPPGPSAPLEPSSSPASPGAAAEGALAAACALCGDRFPQYYDDEREQWQLRNATTVGTDYYHPLCYEDYKASQAKEEAEDMKEEPPAEETPPEAIPDDSVVEIKDFEETASQSDDESVVEVVDNSKEEEAALLEPVEIDEGDEDDVIYKAEPVEQVVVDDNDTDDETRDTRTQRDRDFDFSKIKVKVEPVDPDDEPVITAEEEVVRAKPDTTSTTMLSSIDGNVEPAPEPSPALPSRGIRINITTVTAPVNNNLEEKSLEDISADDEPLPPGEEPELEYTLKPTMEGVQFSRQPPTQKGTELSGLCSIM